LNFKIFLLLFILSGCGVKSDPVSPTAKPMPSFLENYPDIETEQPLQEFKKR